MYDWARIPVHARVDYKEGRAPILPILRRMLQREVPRLRIEFNPKVKWLLVNQSDEKVTMDYLRDHWSMPVIVKRPPYYTNPRYEPYYPLI